jgi:hypothetical protein
MPIPDSPAVSSPVRRILANARAESVVKRI